MKKNLLFLFTILIISGFTIAEGINVTSPRSRSLVFTNSTFTITWRTDTVCTDTNMKINIFRNSISEANFVEQLTCTNTGSKRWDVTNRYAVGNYLIRVKTSDNNCRGDSGVFRITPPPTIDQTVDVPGPPSNTGSPAIPKLTQPVRRIPQIKNNRINFVLPSIKITYPPRNHEWKLRLGNTASPFPIYIMWEKIGIGSQDSRVRILLKRVSPSLQKIVISRNTANSGLFRGGIPRNLMTNVYTIIIKTLDGKIRAESDYFYIINAGDDPESR